VKIQGTKENTKRRVWDICVYIHACVALASRRGRVTSSTPCLCIIGSNGLSKPSSPFNGAHARVCGTPSGHSSSQPTTKCLKKLPLHYSHRRLTLSFPRNNSPPPRTWSRNPTHRPREQGSTRTTAPARSYSQPQTQSTYHPPSRS
jgi:hypothetical protein